MKEPFHQVSSCLMLSQFLKKASKNSKNNYRLIEILKTFSKVFENIMYKQMATFTNFNGALEKAMSHSNVSFL